MGKKSGGSVAPYQASQSQPFQQQSFQQMGGLSDAGPRYQHMVMGPAPQYGSQQAIMPDQGSFWNQAPPPPQQMGWMPQPQQPQQPRNPKSRMNIPMPYQGQQGQGQQENVQSVPEQDAPMASIGQPGGGSFNKMRMLADLLRDF